jgi:nitroreductase
MITKPADSSVPLSDIVTNRWSPRAFDGEHLLTAQEIARLAEAARWAPSANNSQPWFFTFAPRGTELHAQVSELGLMGFNQTWAPKASALVIAQASQLDGKGEPAKQEMQYFNLALATSQLVFEAESMGLKAHYMTGVHLDKVTELIGRDGYWTVAVIAVGKQAEIETASPDVVERELAPRSRRPLEQVFSVAN